MQSKSFRLGFVGGALNSAVGYAHYVATQMDGIWDLQAGCFSRTSSENQKAAQSYGVSENRTYSNLSELIKNEKDSLDALAILTPTDTHYEMVLECINGEIPVICEKSLTVTADQAKQIQKSCIDKNSFLAVIYNYSGYPMVRELRKMINDNLFGKIIHFQAEMPQEGYVRTDANGNKPKPQDWRLRDGIIPTIYLDLGVHLHELVYYLTGQKPLEVIADQNSRGWFDVIDNVSCLARYSNKLQGQFWFSKCALGHRNGLRLRIYGEKAAAEWYQLNPEELLISYRDGKRVIFDRASNPIVASSRRYERFKSGHPAGFNEALANLYFDIHAALAKYKETGKQLSDEVFDATLALEGMQLMDAMVRSSKSNCWEKCC